MLRPGGYMLATVGGLQQVSRYDMERWGDYWRFNSFSIKKLLEEYFSPNNIDVVTYGNLVSVIAGLQGLAIDDLTARENLDKSDDDYPLVIGVVAKK